MRYIAIFCASFFITACSLDASITSSDPTTSPFEPPSLKAQNGASEFVTGEVVTTYNGTLVKGVFGVLSERKVLNNGVEIEGAFYE